MMRRSSAALVRFLAAASVGLLGLALLTAQGSIAVVRGQAATISLQDAREQGLVEITRIVGNRTNTERDLYFQPMLLMGLRNQTQNELNLELPVGSRFRALGQGSDLLATRFARPVLTLAGGETNEKVGIIAYQIDVETFVDDTQAFEYSGITTDAAELKAVNTLHAAGGFSDSDIVPQLALWRILKGYDCEQLDTQLEPVLGTTLGCGGELAQSTQGLVEQAIGSDENINQPNALDSEPLLFDNSVLWLAIIVVPVVLIGIGVLLSRNKKSSTEDDSSTTAGSAPSPTPPAPAPVAKPPSDPSDGRVVGRRSGNVRTAPLPQPSGQNPSPSSAAEPVSEGSRRTAEPTEPAPQQKSKRAAITTEPAPAPRRQAVLTEGFDQQPSQSDVIRELPKQLSQPQVELHPLDTLGGSREIINIDGEIMLTREDIYQTEIDDAAISAPHCFIRFTGKWEIRDLNSRNGTFVDNTRLPPQAKSYSLQSGQVVQLGSMELIFTGDADGQHAELVTRDRSRKYSNASNVSPYWIITNRKLQIKVIDDKTISVPHAVISFENGWRIRDLNSTGGISLQRQAGRMMRLQDKPVLLRTDDQIRLSHRIIYTCKQPDLPSFHGYQFIAWAGKGRLASVFLAKQQEQPEDYVVKLIRRQTPDTNQAFQMECELLRDLRDKSGVTNITPYITHAEHEEHGPYLVQKYIDGMTLGSALRMRQIPLDIDTAVAITLSLCETLQEIHNYGYVHCDIKPDNILLSKDGSVYLADFGAATKQGEQIHFRTQGYFPPDSDGTAHPRLDIYSLTVVLYEMVKAELPAMNNVQSTGERPAGRRGGSLQTNPLPPQLEAPQQPPILERIFTNVMQPKTRTGTIQTINDLRQQLEPERSAQPTPTLVRQLLADLVE